MTLKRPRKNASLRRKSSGFETRVILIVCQGRETEKNYFKALRNYYGKEGIDIKIKDESPSRMMEFAEKYCTYEKIRYIETWLVFDKDDTPPDIFNKIVRETDGKRGYGSAFSNPCFELWICLHYQLMGCHFNQKKCQEEIKKLFLKHEKREYKKNDTKIFETLKDKMKTAIDNAHKLHTKHKNTLPSEANPSTTVHLLIKSLEKKAKLS